MDDVDRKILAELQADGRLTLTELADRVRLSVSPCHRRLRTLERSGAIAGYHAQLDASVLGLTFEALVFVTMRYADRQTVAAFEEHVADIPNVLQAQRLFGDPDYLLRVVARDLPAYRELYDERLATLPGVLRVSSTLVMKSVVDARPEHHALAGRGLVVVEVPAVRAGGRPGRPSFLVRLSQIPFSTLVTALAGMATSFFPQRCPSPSSTWVTRCSSDRPCSHAPARSHRRGHGRAHRVRCLSHPAEQRPGQRPAPKVRYPPARTRRR